MLRFRASSAHAYTLYTSNSTISSFLATSKHGFQWFSAVFATRRCLSSATGIAIMYGFGFCPECQRTGKFLNQLSSE